MHEKFIFSKFGGLQAYSWQLPNEAYNAYKAYNYQMNSITGIFRQYFKLPPYSPHVLT